MKNKIEEYVNELCKKLNLSEYTRRDSLRLIKRVMKNKLLNKKKKEYLYISCVYISALICDEKKTQERFCKIAGLSTPILRKYYTSIAITLGGDDA